MSFAVIPPYGVAGSPVINPNEANIQTHKFTSTETFSPLSGLTAEQQVQVIIDASEITEGVINVEADGLLAFQVLAGQRIIRVIDVAVSLDIITVQEGESWELNNLTHSSTKSVNSEDSFPNGMASSPDGKMLYVMGATNDRIFQYSSATPWVAASFSYDNKSFLTTGQASNIAGIFLKPDGTKMWTLDSINKIMYQYTLTTAFDVSTMQYDNISKTMTNNGQKGVFWKADGLSFWTSSEQTDEVEEWRCTEAWNLSTASFIKEQILSNLGTPESLWFKPDGTKLYVVGRGAAVTGVHQFDLTTPWDIATQTFVRSLNVAGFDTFPRGIAMSADGIYLVIDGSQGDTIETWNATATGGFTGTGRATVVYA